MYTTHTRLQELRNAAYLCQRAVDMGCATILERAYADLYRTFQYKVDGTLKDQKVKGQGPHLSILFGK